MRFKLFLKRNLSPKSIQQKILQIVLKGNEVECICCGGKYLTFLPTGLNRRANARCVKCNSLERHRMIWLFLQRETDLFTKSVNLLHVAPEKLFYNNFKKNSNINYTAIDLQPEKYGYSGNTIRMDLTDLKFKDESFDAIICSHVLEHVHDDKKAIAEMYRVLKKTGWAILNVPVDYERETTFEDLTINDPIKQLEIFGQPDHVRIYGKDYILRLNQAGFNVQVFDYTKTLSHNECFKYGFKPKNEIYFCTK